MAKAETVSKMTVVGITLELSLKEAEVLAAILRNVAGDARTTNREHTEAIRKALENMGVRGDSKEDSALGISGVIVCH